MKKGFFVLGKNQKSGLKLEFNGCIIHVFVSVEIVKDVTERLYNIRKRKYENYGREHKKSRWLAYK